MKYSALVYLQRINDKSARIIGWLDVEVEGDRIHFVHQGRIELGRVEKIEPWDWLHRGRTPTIHVVQSVDQRREVPAGPP